MIKSISIASEMVPPLAASVVKPPSVAIAFCTLSSGCGGIIQSRLVYSNFSRQTILQNINKCFPFTFNSLNLIHCTFGFFLCFIVFCLFPFLSGISATLSSIFVSTIKLEIEINMEKDRCDTQHKRATK